MKNETFTQWFGRTEKPVHVGVYQIHSDDSAFPNLTWHAYWDGQFFRYLHCQGPDKAAEYAHRNPSWKQNLRWRGLAKP